MQSRIAEQRAHLVCESIMDGAANGRTIVLIDTVNVYVTVLLLVELTLPAFPALADWSMRV